MFQLLFSSLVVLFLFQVGCSSIQKDYSYMNKSTYQNKRQLQGGSLVKDDKGGLTEASIKNLLESRIKMPKKISLAVFRLGNSQQEFDFEPLDDEIATEFYQHSNWGKRVQSVIPVPSIMLPSNVSMKSMRDAAALLQADALLVITPNTQMDWRLRVLDENEAKAFTHFEVLLIDTRTGAIPYTFMASRSAKVIKGKSDYSNQEMMNRAKFLSEKKAYLSLRPKVRAFLNTVR